MCIAKTNRRFLLQQDQRKPQMLTRYRLIIKFMYECQAAGWECVVRDVLVVLLLNLFNMAYCIYPVCAEVWKGHPEELCIFSLWQGAA